MDMLPDFMKICYEALPDTMNEMGYWIEKKHGHNPTKTLRTLWATLCNAFLVEAEWFASGDLPTADKYLENGKLSSRVRLALVHSSLLGIGQTTQNAIHLNDTSRLISSVGTILCLWDDLGSAKR
ncbi:(3S,6E)-nerolidol synthase 1-like isoform X1 [Olea europaea subsp. europaea]|uniref:(3S,6E)-nerolidol synthase 1-like isoform X1 n=1 Tax=Olea europaea subsp. europaea TaxID=158383 RepID=A0A8S0V281_OLEEU|nr:(3S,6E)-nerolidol synthase 1-like isoform X1 [Olea europaea subsp. europaea]